MDNPTPADPEVRLLVPADDELDPELSIVIPALNEAVTIAEFVAWCKEGIAKAGVRGEILIVDSSSDATPELALAGGARVLRTPKRGLGRAYIDAIPYIRGQFVLMGDCDCTYDFRELTPFIERFREGYEFIMGSRFRGYIEPGAMPPLHRYFGTPLTTWILNFMFSASFSDIHCGMRGITTEALRRLDLQSQSWEYASEMVLKSVHWRLRTAEVPIRFLKDKEGRLSQHRRLGWFSPWQAGWINLQAMFVYGADFFLLRPGAALLALGLPLTVAVLFGPLKLGPITLSLYWMLLGLSLTVLGQQCVYMGLLASAVYDYTGARMRRLRSVFRYTRSALVSGALFCLGLGLCIPMVRDYVAHGYVLLPAPQPFHYLTIAGLLCLMTAFLFFMFVLLVHALDLHLRRRPPSTNRGGSPEPG